ncbi:MAG TPA: hypothetical protein VFR87_18335 [Nocardioidaceae bacterium]|nr:hypothetical protein [Nocardioidaceae bacterium]
MNENDFLTGSTRDLVHHAMQSTALALYAAAAAMFAAMLVVLGATGDFPGRWWVAVAGVLAAAVVVHVRSNELYAAPPEVQPSGADG